MSWEKRYDKCNSDNEGNLIIMGNHYNKEECNKIIEEENYDEWEDYCNPEPIYLKFGFVHYEGELSNGYIEFESYKKGRIKATRLITKENRLQDKAIKKEIAELDKQYPTNNVKTKTEKIK